MKPARIALNIWVGLHFAVAIGNMIIGMYVHSLLMILMAVVIYYVLDDMLNQWGK